MAAAAVTPKIAVVGLRKLRRDLGRMVPGSERLVASTIREILQPIAGDARSEAADFSEQIPPTIRGVAYATQGSIRSRLPQAGVWEFGGTIEPRGHPIVIEGQHFVLDAWEENATTTMAALEREFEGFARRYGFNGP